MKQATHEPGMLPLTMRPVTAVGHDVQGVVMHSACQHPHRGRELRWSQPAYAQVGIWRALGRTVDVHVAHRRRRVLGRWRTI